MASADVEAQVNARLQELEQINKVSTINIHKTKIKESESSTGASHPFNKHTKVEFEKHDSIVISTNSIKHTIISDKCVK